MFELKKRRIRRFRDCALFICIASSLVLAILPGFVGAASAETSAQREVPGNSSSTLKVGDQIPAFRATDQFGNERDFQDLKGPNGLVILFFRSADW